MPISLSKNQTVDLTKKDGGLLSNIRLGLGWDIRTVTQKGFLGFGSKQVQKDIDLDAGALLLDAQGRLVDKVYWNKPRSTDGALFYPKDNRSGEGEGDDESVIADLTKVDPKVEHIVLVVTSYSGEPFSEVDNAYVRVVDSERNDEEVARFSLSDGQPRTGLVFATVSRKGSGWAITALGEYANGRVAPDLAAAAAAAVRH